MIEHSNIIYMPNISALGGIETYVYELVRKYKDLDICVVTKRIDEKQQKRLKELCPVYIHTNQKIQCDVAIINYDISIIDFINKDAKIYQVIHGDYSNKAYTCKPPTDPRITKSIGITKHICETYKELIQSNDVILSYNPLTIEDEDYLTLVSATRLSRVKGKDRMIKLRWSIKQKRNKLYLVCIY